MATRSNSQQMAVLRIGHYDYVLPMAKAIKAMEQLSCALQVNVGYGDLRHTYTVEGEISLRMTMIQADQLVMPEGIAHPVKRGRSKPALLGHEPLKLEF